MKIKKPDYNDCIVNVTNSILKHYGFREKHSTLPKLDKILEKNYKNIIYVIFDGMGSYILDSHLNKDSFLHKQKINDLTSVFPSTTGAAIPSILSGLTPKEHGWLDWACYFKEYGRTIELFRNNDYFTKEPVDTGLKIFDSTLKYESIVEIIAEKVNVYEILPSFKPNGFENIAEAFANLVKLCNQPDKKFIHFYWDNPDKLLHKKGCLDFEIKNMINDYNNYFEDIAKKVKDTLIIITADHGLTDIEESDYIYLNNIPEIYDYMATPPYMDWKATFFNIKSNKIELFKKCFNKLFKDEFILCDKEQYINEFLGSGNPHKRLDDFVGDFVAISTGKKAFCYKLLNAPDKKINKATHGGLTEEEMIVPLIVIEKK